jgi:hypothetical protein
MYFYTLFIIIVCVREFIIWQANNIQVQMSVDEALAFLRQLRALETCCLHRSFTQVILAYTADESVAAVEAVIKFLRDILLHACASSIDVEKLHATTLAGNKVIGYAGKTKKTVQMETYTTSARLAWSRINTEAGTVMKSRLSFSSQSCLQ